MIVVTGATNFIGHCLIRRLNAENFKAIVAVDEFVCMPKDNFNRLFIQEKIKWNSFMLWLDRHQSTVEFIFHLGTGASNIPEQSSELSHSIDMEYSMALWDRCASYQIPLVYASSAAVYGRGEEGVSENISPDILKPLDNWGRAKLNFDRWATQQQKAPFYWAGLRLFTVYGTHESVEATHASIACRTLEQISTTGMATLYRSKNLHYRDEEQTSDFVYVEDVVNVCFFLMHYRKQSGLYNVGSGKVRTFLDLVKIMFQALKKREFIKFTETPICTGLTNMYSAEARLDKLKRIGFVSPFHTLEEGICNYVRRNSDKDTI